MTPQQAASLIGCDVSQVRNLIRHGKIKAQRKQVPGGFYYDITRQQAIKYANTKTGGWPRGQSRN